MPQSRKTKTSNNVAINSIKNLKMDHIKKTKKRRWGQASGVLNIMVRDPMLPSGSGQPGRV